MIVVDTNIIAYLFITGERSGQAERVLLKDAEWAAPFLWRSEFRNVLALYLRQKLLTVEDAYSILHEAETLLFGREYAVDSEHVLRLAAASHCSAYDCEFVAVAQELNSLLVTEDRKILAAFPQATRSLEQFLMITPMK